MYCHHKIPVKLGGKDNYSNLILLTEDAHILLYATDGSVIKHYMSVLNLNRNQIIKLNKLRNQAGLDVIEWNLF